MILLGRVGERRKAGGRGELWVVMCRLRVRRMEVGGSVGGPAFACVSHTRARIYIHSRAEPDHLSGGRARRGVGEWGARHAGNQSVGNQISAVYFLFLLVKTKKLRKIEKLTEVFYRKEEIKAPEINEGAKKNRSVVFIKRDSVR